MARFISEHALEEITVEHVARAVDLHPNYAMTIYKRAVGLTINRSIVRQRLDTAQSLLIATDMPAAKVAFELGLACSLASTKPLPNDFAAGPGIPSTVGESLEADRTGRGRLSPGIILQ